MRYIEYSLNELNILESASVPISEQNTDEVLFGFAELNAGDDMRGSWGGFSFRLYETGLVKVQEYLFGETLAEERRYCVPQTCVDEIKQYYSEEQEKIYLLKATHNHSCDGSFSKLFFGFGWISTLNIRYHNEEDFMYAREAHKEKNSYEAIESIMIAENEIMTIFHRICDILKNYNIFLDQLKVTVNGVSTTTYHDFMEQISDSKRKQK